MTQEEKIAQDAWLFKLIGKNKLKVKATQYVSGYKITNEYYKAEDIRDLFDSEREKVIEQMKIYWANHEQLSTEFLVNGAVVGCSQGEKLSRIEGKDHGVYTDNIGGQALLNEDDRSIYKEGFGSIFGTCKYETGKNKKCKAEIFSKWYGTNQSTQIGEGKASLTMSSYMNCPLHRKALIQPVTSGQEFTFSGSLFKYPKFVVESGEEVIYSNVGYWNSYNFYKRKIDITVIRKLAIRNMSFLNTTIDQTNSKGYYERKWLEYLAKYMLLCNSKEKLRDIINKFYDKPSFGIASAVAKNNLLDNYNLLFQSASSWIQDILNNQRNETFLRTVGLWLEEEDVLARVIENHFLLAIMKMLTNYRARKEEDAIVYINVVDSLDEGIKKYYGNGIDIHYYTIDAVTSIRPAHTYISKARIDLSTSDMECIWDYFGKNRANSFVELLVINLGATYALSKVTDVTVTVLGTLISLPVALAASVAWTVVSSYGAAWIEEKAAEEFEKKRYEQSRKGLGDLLSKLKVYTIFTNNDENADSFTYQVFPSSETEILINNFMNNISRIYIKKNEWTKEEKCLIDILELNNISDKPLKLKIDCLIAALTLDTMTNMRIFGVDDEKIVYNTGMQLLGKLYELRCGREEYITQVQIENRRINIIDTPYYIKNEANNRYADIDKLFTEIL